MHMLAAGLGRLVSRTSLEDSMPTPESGLEALASRVTKLEGVPL
jgi:hypothetical protein